MWQSRVEIEHYSASVKNELTVLIKALRLPPHRVQVPAHLLIVRVVRPQKCFDLRCCIEYTRGKIWQDSMLCISSCVMATTRIRPQQ